jgi:hypothetical protein
LRPRKRRFFTRALHFYEFAVFRSHKVEINSDKLVPFIVKIQYCPSRIPALTTATNFCVGGASSFFPLRASDRRWRAQDLLQ